MVLATFISICIAAVLFMLRFLLALDSEAKASQRHSRAGVQSVLLGRTANAAPAITLVRSRPRWALRPNHVVPMATFQPEERSQYRVG